jgi:hypothetical protein
MFIRVTNEDGDLQYENSDAWIIVEPMDDQTLVNRAHNLRGIIVSAPFSEVETVPCSGQTAATPDWRTMNF